MKLKRNLYRATLALSAAEWVGPRPLEQFLADLRAEVAARASA